MSGVCLGVEKNTLLKDVLTRNSSTSSNFVNCCSMVDIIGVTYMIIQEERVSWLDIEYVHHVSSRIMGEMAMASI